jgi:hypothetical protein
MGYFVAGTLRRLSVPFTQYDNVVLMEEGKEAARLNRISFMSG